MMQFTGVVSESPAHHCLRQCNIYHHPGDHPPTCFSSLIHRCLHFHWHPYDLSLIKHASIQYLCADVHNVRNNLSDTPAIQRSSQCVCVTTHMRSQIDMLTCTFLVLLSLLCSTVIAALRCCIYSWFLHLLSASSGVSLSLLSLYCSLLCQRHSSVSIQHEQWTPPSIIQLIHMPRQ